LTSTSTDEERSSADICALDTIRRRKRSGLVAKSADEFVRSLSKPLGESAAKREVNQALQDLKISYEDIRPSSLRLLRGRLEANLSGLLGPSIAREIIDSYLPYSIVSQHGSTDLNVIESRIESYRSNLSGMAADLDNLRRYHRQILLELPLGVCSLSIENEIVMWNRALADLTEIDTADVVGSQLVDLPEPWRNLLNNFLDDSVNHSYKRNFQLKGQKKSVNLHKAYIDKPSEQDLSHEGVIILIEDITETEILEAGLTHSERLASIGRLAAGVAHEIGNPITGIACLAQTIRDEFDGTELEQLAGQIIEQTDRTSKILQSLVNFAHAGTSNTDYEKQAVNISECMQEALTLISLDKKSKDVEIGIECEDELQILGDAQKLLQVMVNLINNARDASVPGSHILMQALRVGNRVKITVTDDGVGIPEAIRDRVFDPFFTTKEAGEGTGLGLSLVFSIVEDLGGDIDIISPVNKSRGTGTQVVVWFSEFHDDSDTEIERHEEAQFRRSG
jgi:signal transduction histidine kinase